MSEQRQTPRPYWQVVPLWQQERDGRAEIKRQEEALHRRRVRTRLRALKVHLAQVRADRAALRRTAA